MTTKDELARDIFLADNTSAAPGLMEKEWDENPTTYHYAHAIAEGLIAKGYRKYPVASEREWGVTYADEHGNLHTEWGYARSPLDQVDEDGEIQVGKRDWGKAYEILSRPKAEQTSEWQASDCPWKEGAKDDV